MRQMTVGVNDAGQRLDKFLLKALPALPKTLMYKFLRTRHIKLNGKKAEISTRLSEGDILTFFISDEFFIQDSQQLFMQARPEIQTVYEDENILLVNKPSGLIVYEDEGESVDTLINRVLHYLYK